MKTVIIDKERLEPRIENKSLVFDGKRIPLSLVELLVLPHDTTLSSALLLKLSAADIAVLMVSRTNSGFALTLPQVAKNGAQKMAQYAALKNRLGLAKYFVDEKISRHASHLRTMGVVVELAEWKERVNSCETIEALLGVEGSFSRFYFSHFFASLPPLLHKGCRSKQPPKDPVNAVLSFLYTIGYNVLTAILYRAGFDPAIGYLHEPFRSHYAMASDFMELYRDKANALCAELFLDKVLDTGDFSRKNGVYLRFESRKKLWKPIKEYIDAIEADMTKEIALLRAALS